MKTGSYKHLAPPEQEPSNQRRRVFGQSQPNINSAGEDVFGCEGNPI